MAPLIIREEMRFHLLVTDQDPISTCIAFIRRCCIVVLDSNISLIHTSILTKTSIKQNKNHDSQKRQKLLDAHTHTHTKMKKAVRHAHTQTWKKQ